MNTVSMALPSDHRMMVAWKAFQETDEFKNALRWAIETKYDDGRPIDDIQREQHAKGSLWLAFTKGIEITEERCESDLSAAQARIKELEEELAACKLCADDEAMERDMQLAAKEERVQTITTICASARRRIHREHCSGADHCQLCEQLKLALSDVREGGEQA